VDVEGEADGECAGESGSEGHKLVVLVIMC